MFQRLGPLGNFLSSLSFFLVTLIPKTSFFTIWHTISLQRTSKFRFLTFNPVSIIIYFSLSSHSLNIYRAFNCVQVSPQVPRIQWNREPCAVWNCFVTTSLDMCSTHRIQCSLLKIHHLHFYKHSRLIFFVNATITLLLIQMCNCWINLNIGRKEKRGFLLVSTPIHFYFIYVLSYHFLIEPSESRAFHSNPVHSWHIIFRISSS